ncbi:MAG: hypothetical protein M3153_11995, partial [Chloroflexota bacterium]|nr:hypothetical protein [Chloroflexota bacterium]
MKRLASLLVMLMLVVSIGIAVVLSSEVRESPRVSGSPEAPVPTGAPIATSPAPTPAAMPESFAFGEPNTPSPGETGQSRLWFHDGEWWGVFLNGPTGDQRVFRFDANSRAWTDTGVAVDERAFALMDIVSDGDRVVIASAGPQPEPRHALRIVRFSYDPAARIYRRDANFPIPITDLGVESLTAARSDDGRLWVAYRQGA